MEVVIHLSGLTQPSPHCAVGLRLPPGRTARTASDCALPPHRCALRSHPLWCFPLIRENREEEIRLYKKTLKGSDKLMADSVDVADRQPAFLKDKGDALYKQGNFRCLTVFVWGGLYAHLQGNFRCGGGGGG